MVFVRFLNPLLMIVLGLGAGVVAAGRRSNAWRLYSVGAWTFVLSQVFHIPFNSLVLSGWLEGLRADGYELLVLAVALGLSAGVFEEVARYLAYRFAAREARGWRDGLVLGAGHGGIEAVLIGAFALYTVFQLTALRGQDVSLLLPGRTVEELARVQAQVAAFWALPWYAVLLGALERFFAIAFHLSASLLVLQAFLRRSTVWLVLAVIWHALLDATAVYVSSAWGVYAAEAVLGVFGLASLLLIWLLRGEDQGEPPPDGDVPEPVVLERVQVSEEQLDESRYAQVSRETSGDRVCAARRSRKHRAGGRGHPRLSMNPWTARV